VSGADCIDKCIIANVLIDCVPDVLPAIRTFRGLESGFRAARQAKCPYGRLSVHNENCAWIEPDHFLSDYVSQVELSDSPLWINR
jgi:hypothetical protein